MYPHVKPRGGLRDERCAWRLATRTALKQSAGDPQVACVADRAPNIYKW